MIRYIYQITGGIMVIALATLIVVGPRSRTWGERMQNVFLAALLTFLITLLVQGF